MVLKQAHTPVSAAAQCQTQHHAMQNSHQTQVTWRSASTGVCTAVALACCARAWKATACWESCARGPLRGLAGGIGRRDRLD